MTETTVAATQRLGIETTGIEIIDESERTAQPKDLFWPWFAANVSVFGISYGSFVLGFGISFVQALVVTVVGIVVSASGSDDVGAALMYAGCGSMLAAALVLITSDRSKLQPALIQGVAPALAVIALLVAGSGE